MAWIPALAVGRVTGTGSPPRTPAISPNPEYLSVGLPFLPSLRDFFVSSISPLSSTPSVPGSIPSPPTLCTFQVISTWSLGHISLVASYASSLLSLLPAHVLHFTSGISRAGFSSISPCRHVCPSFHPLPSECCCTTLLVHVVSRRHLFDLTALTKCLPWVW